MSMSAAKKAKNREARHRGVFIRGVEREYLIIEEQFKEKQGLVESRLFGTNEYGNKRGTGRIADLTPIDGGHMGEAVTIY